MLRMQLVGGMKVELDGVIIAPPPSRRAWAVLAWLGLHPGLHHRATLAAAFWPDVPDVSARANLRSAIWALRRSLGPGANPYLQVGRDRLGLREDALVWIDVRAMEDCIARGRIEAALDLGCGVLLEEFDGEWVFAARDAHVPKIAGLLERLAARAQARGDMAAAIAWTRRQAELEPFSERPVQRLMRRFEASGDRAAALTAYDRFRGKLADELRITPAAQTQQIVAALKLPPAASGPHRESIVRAWPLIGRTSELAQLLASWQVARQGRLTVATITGEPGIGKTRLATELLGVAQHDGALAAAATALGLGPAAPFGLWAELIGGLTSCLDAVPIEAGWLEVLSPLAPALGSPFGHQQGTARASPDLDRARLYEATVGMLDWMSRSGPVAMLCDDVLAADAPSLELVGYVCRRLASSPIFIMLARRPLPHRVQVDALEHALRAQRTLTTEIRLGPLDDLSIVRLTSEVAALPEGQVSQVVAASDGNALLAVEWATALGRGVDSPPESLRAAVRMALVPLQDGALELAHFLAVAGRSLDGDEIAGLSLPDDATAGAAECTLMVAERGRIGFRHALLRDAAYADLPDPVRRHLHARLGDLLGGGPARNAAEAAKHLQLAGRGERAVDQFVRAAEYARSMAALPAAEAMLCEALALRPDDPALLRELAVVDALLGAGTARA